MFLSKLPFRALALALPLALAAAPAALPGGARGAVPNHEGVELYPKPSGSLVLGGKAERQSLYQVAQSLAELSGLHFTMRAEARGLLEATEVHLTGPVTVPPDELHSFVESLLLQHGFVLSELRGSEPRLVEIHRVRNNDYSVLRACRAVAVDDLAAYEDHPAMMIRTVVPIAPLDGDRLSNHLRQLVVDSSYQQVVSSGSPGAVTVSGSAGWVLDMAATLRQIVAARPKAEAP